MTKPCITYYEALAKLSQIANKQTLFLGHLLHEMEYDKDSRQFLLDLSTFKKVKIMKTISPAVDEKAMPNLANQYLSKLQATGIIRNLGRGVWAVNPMCYGQFKTIPKDLRKKNEKIFLTLTLGPDGIETTEVGLVDKVDS